MKKSVLSIVLTVVMLFSLTATVWGSAWPVVDSGYCGYWDDNYSDRKNMTWQLMKDGTLEFFGEGYMEDFSYYSVPWKDYVDQIKEVVIYGPQDELKSCIFSIGRYAFSGCKNLKKISIPVSVEIIGLAAFSGSGIESIHLPANLKTISSAALAVAPI